MLRTRLLFFVLGFSVTGAAVSHFVWRDLWTEQHSIYSEMKQKFDALDKRLSSLESNVSQKLNVAQDES